MKKLLAILAASAAVLCMSAFEVVEVSSPASGEEFVVSAGGKLVAVQAFSVEASGTVALSSVFEAPVYTNAVLIRSSSFTNYVVVSSNRIDRALATNTLPRDVYGPFKVSAWQNLHPFDVFVSVATNEVEVVATNAWPVLKEIVAVTNALVSGTCSGHVYSGSPASAAYVKPRERLVFSGTATGGFLRLILE